jgi:hypothetical protein
MKRYAPLFLAVFAICFQRETGAALANHVNLVYPPLEEMRTSKVFFAPDGKHVLMVCEANGERFLRRATLRLSAAEQAALSK